jgi:hypothetical protein
MVAVRESPGASRSVVVSRRLMVNGLDTPVGFRARVAVPALVRVKVR